MSELREILPKPARVAKLPKPARVAKHGRCAEGHCVKTMLAARRARVRRYRYAIANQDWKQV